MMMILSKLKKAVLLFCLLIVIAACAKGGASRGQFQGYALEKTEAEIVDKFGKPAEVDTKNPTRIVLTYHKRTFDADNNDTVDPTTRVILEKNKEGKFVCTSFEYL